MDIHAATAPPVAAGALDDDDDAAADAVRVVADAVALPKAAELEVTTDKAVELAALTVLSTVEMALPESVATTRPLAEVPEALLEEPDA